ncbi:carboxylating nicotinate-nucleotide diphosphorylase [Candidatus Nitronereus thalassa]|uniref:nicotinate-nucleotide diphosphorylase (carboxylating) n=1 Tax=Candidatus Nitronereus thalassa TaxID=3020898 RepID=A0ABU3K3Y8_9BACT|nr:carboxylating nicotinate-nucleotide diphosphorylase [Candidatus Nitronereus thalassa]MDT7041098.1 carboxylating nicotinate-nucleotide diphosphorylase [Candidatus Nitronereus thalassa]
MSSPLLSPHELDPLVRQALKEDISYGDVTSETLIPSSTTTRAVIRAKQGVTVAGIPVLQKVFELLNHSVSITVEHGDGETILSGQTIATLEGNTRSILTGERVALNFLQHLSGIATLTKQYCDAVRDYPTKILDTRKTTPGLRTLQKWAVVMGGGTNHRMSLNDGILIKDNHLAILKAHGISLTQACHLARENGPHCVKICVEIEALEEIEPAIQGQVDVLLLDNMTPDVVRKAVTQIKGRALVEASGGITLANIREYAAAGTDYISIGALTHSAPSVDLSLEIL